MIIFFETLAEYSFDIFFLIAPISLFILGLFGLIWYRYDVIRLFIALELMILSVNTLFIEISFFYLDSTLESQVVILLILAIAACEAAIGLGLLIITYRAKGTIVYNKLNSIKG